MSDNKFDPEKISIVEFKILTGQVNTSEDFDTSKVESYRLANELQFAYNREERLIKADFTTEITTESRGQNQRESSGSFHFVFIYYVENWEELNKSNKNNIIEPHPVLINALSSITYSTSRGILLTRLQGTALQNFVLPIINPNSLLKGD